MQKDKFLTSQTLPSSIQNYHIIVAQKQESETNYYVVLRVFGWRKLSSFYQMSAKNSTGTYEFGTLY